MKKLLLGICIAGSLFAASCKKEDTPVNPPSKNAQVAIRLTDAPGAYEAVNIDVQRVEINHETQGWISFTPLRTGIYNVLDFRNGTDALLCQGEIPPGSISQIRLVLGNNNSVMIKGNVYPLATPSAQQSGLKLNLHEDLAANISYSFWLDFDAGRSIVVNGGGDSYSLKPTMRVYTQLTDGRIKGTIALMAPATIVYAIRGADTFSTYPTADGRFMFCGLPEGNYTLRIESATTARLEVPGVSVRFGEVTDLGVLTLLP